MLSSGLQHSVLKYTDTAGAKPDFDTLTSNGVFCVAPGSPNAPVNNQWCIVYVVQINSNPLFVTQLAILGDGAIFGRGSSNGNWKAWRQATN